MATSKFNHLYSFVTLDKEYFSNPICFILHLDIIPEVKYHAKAKVISCSQAYFPAPVSGLRKLNSDNLKIYLMPLRDDSGVGSHF